jgi:hypothetical protein
MLTRYKIDNKVFNLSRCDCFGIYPDDPKSLFIQYFDFRHQIEHKTNEECLSRFHDMCNKVGIKIDKSPSINKLIDKTNMPAQKYNSGSPE